MATPSRIEIARHRVRVTRISLATVATAAFAVFAFAARAAHPGSSAGAATTGTQASVVPSEDDTTAGDEFGFGSSSVSPSYDTAPSLQSGGS